MNEKIKEFVEERVAYMKYQVEKNNDKIGLYILTDNSSKQSTSYMKAKVKLGTEIGIPTEVIEVTNVKDLLVRLAMASAAGYKTILQKPCDHELEKAYDRFGKATDVDGFYTWNETVKGIYANAPCTSTGILNFLKWELGSLKGKTVVVVGRGDLSGKPMMLQMVNEGATTICLNSTTPEDVKRDVLLLADIVICATGAYGTVKASYLKTGTIVMDVGMCFDTGKLSGEFVEDVQGIAKASKTPGGTGKLTVLTLFENVINSSRI